VRFASNRTCAIVCRQVRRIVNKDNAYRGTQQEDPRQYEGIHRFIVVDVPDHRATDEPVKDLGYRDEEIENTHVDTHLPWRYGTRKDYIGHGQNTCPGYTDQRHGQDEELFIWREKK